MIVEGDKNRIARGMDRSRTENYLISAISYKVERLDLRINHPLQRESQQWDKETRDNYIATIFQNEKFPPVVICEQPYGNISISWLIDGVQRVTTAISFLKNEFKLGKNIERYIVYYRVALGGVDENGQPLTEEREFDIRGKKFKDFPKELQTMYSGEYSITALQILGCDDEDIAYHLRRFNRSKPMTAAQKGVTHLSRELANVVQNLKKHPFIGNQRDRKIYRPTEKKNGTLDRVITESVMAMTHLDDWTKVSKDICRYLAEHATISDFNRFERVLDRLDEVITPDVADLFNSKDSFIWFTVFDRFTALGKTDAEFVDFLAAFKASLHDKPINGVTYDHLSEEKATKDKAVVQAKIALLMELIQEHFGVVAPKKISLLDFVRANVDSEANQDDIDLYVDTLNDMIKTVDKSSPLLDHNNQPSLVSIVALSYKEDVDIENWFEEYFATHYNYKQDQKENYEAMRKSLLAQIQVTEGRRINIDV